MEELGTQIKTALLTEDDAREFTFTYATAYLAQENCDAISLTM